MDSIFCCSSILPYRPKALDHEQKFEAFMHWDSALRSSLLNTVKSSANLSLGSSLSYVVQVVCQVNYGPLESKRYFSKATEGDGKEDFCEVTEKDLIDANYQKLNS